MPTVPIDRKNFDWIRNVEDILSKETLEIRQEGTKIVSDYDLVLSHFSGNLSLLYALPEAKEILNAYRRSMERIATAVKRIYKELSKLRNATKIYLDDEPYFLQEDNTIFKQEDINVFEEAIYNLQEAFRQLGRSYLYTLISAIEPFIETEPKPQEEVEPVMTMPNYNIPMGQAYYYPAVPQQTNEQRQ